MTDWAVDKPSGFYLSSFRCVSAFVAKRVAEVTPVRCRTSTGSSFR